MNAVLQVARAGRGAAGWLVAGLLAFLLAVGALLALSVGSAVLALRPSLDAGAAGLAAVLVLPTVVRGLGIGRVLLRYVERLVTHSATFRFLASLRVWLFRGLAARSAGGLGMARSGDVLSRLVGDVEALDGLYLRIAVPGVAAVLLLPVLVAADAASGFGAVLAVGGLFLLASVVLPALAARSTRRLGARLAEAAASLRTAALDSIEGLREVLAYGAAERTTAALRERERILIAAQRDIARRGALAQAGAFLCGQVALLVVVLAGGPPAALVPSMFLTLAAFEVVSGMPRAGVLAGHAASAAERIVAVADGPADPDPPRPSPLPSGTGLQFEAVQFQWQPDRPPVLDGLTLDIPAGSRVAILGPSGAGKSTLVSLALKVARPQAGRVLLGGVDLSLLPAAVVRSRMAWLGQDTHLFHDTVRANLLLGRPDATDAELWDALAQAQIAQRVAALPGGLDAMLGATGLSGGEARRVALARALVSHAPILLLDEPAAGLDAATEIAFFQTLNGAAQGRTMVLIVHRLTGVEQLDRIWRITAGRVVAAAA